MPHVVDTERLIAERVITAEQGREIARQSRETMVGLAVNSVLCIGIIAATLGLVFWLADAMAVAVAGAVFLGLGGMILSKGSALYRMLGNAAALVGSGMLVAGAGIELFRSYPYVAEPFMIVGGALLGLLSLAVFMRAGPG